MTDYIYIRAWGQMMNSMEYYIRGEVDKARREKAPADAIYKNHDGKWVTYATIARDDTRALLDRLVEGVQ